MWSNRQTHFRTTTSSPSYATSPARNKSISVEQVLTKWGRIDVLVNNAGITDDNKSVADSTLVVWRRVMGINIEGPMFLMRAVMPHMLKNEMPERGSIVNVCSAAAARGAVAGATYTSSKHALLGLARNTAWMHRHDGIRCSAVLPEGIRTNIVENSGRMIDLSNFCTQL
ncbi:hypothetical protein EDB81DRAFT_801839 [Dactylonectria macrodidyma]|uniref:NAD(P)-binding protein n=1 Tax=Dactylonectria macrodidyma TaxID=307937 RepID=A0A9P9EDB9_9HYPO|nr:hypothetical protein EDB81DRAFT_801839 [Dactylonectria macrodidyma]